MQLVADHWKELDLLEAASAWEKAFEYHFPEVSP
jgi:Asp-tRNA(Asn)/Glu-tRNA(Gln) amidotransferase A subunit family amidase